MQRLRSKQRVDTLKSQEGWKSGRWSRRIYLLILAGIGLLVLNYAVGDALILRADGLVVRNRYAVAATFPAKVAEVFVERGDRVKKGQVLAKLESAEILKEIAQLSVQYADISTRDAQLKIRAATNRDLLPLAEQHAEQTADAVEQYETMEGLIPTNRKDQALGSKYATASRLAELKNESAVIEGQLPLMESAQKRAESALSQLDNFYDNGNIRAPFTGLLGSRIPVPGQVVRFGDEIFDLYGTHSMVLAYLPETYLFPLDAGQKVRLSGGRTSAIGTVQAILPLTEALPPEFQNTFRSRDRGQLVRIDLPQRTPFAVSQEIRVTGCAVGWCWVASDDSSLIGRWWKSIVTKVASL